MTQNVRLQNLRNFTVQIRNDADQIVGTGIAVSMDGKIVTCAHVVQAAGIEPRNPNGAEIGVYFPQARGGDEKNRKAIVAKYFPNYDDDVVLLQLTGGASPLAPEQIAVIGTAGDSQDHPFRSYGYRDLQEYLAGWADGVINGSIECPPTRNLQIDPVQIASSQINGGMSGAAVLDKERNLVVGIISETWIPDSTTKDRDTGWAVDAHVLSLAPIGLSVQDMSLDLKAAPEPKFDIAQAEAAVFIKEKYSWNSAPSVLTEWTGRDDLLAEITKDWHDSTKHVTGLIGFGGEGKSSLARKWIEDVIARRHEAETKQSPINGETTGSGEIASQKPLATTLDGVFWWGFYENRSIDEFLEAALKYLSGGKIDPRAVPSSSLRAQIIGAMLGAGRYLFVLDGLEILQHQEGDQYGLLQSADLRDLLAYFANPNNSSFCLITSRAPLLDLMEYTTYTHRDVDRLSDADGILLLDKLGVNGSQEQKKKVVSDWDGHALTISLLGSYLAEKYNGDIAHLDNIPIPTANEPRYERVHRVLRRYDEHLTESEREFLKLFSAFRTPVHESAFEKVFVPFLKNAALIPDSQITDMVNRLVTYRILHCDTTSQTYTAHPLVRNHYLAILTHGDTTEQHDVHGKIKDYYLSIAGGTPQYPTLDDLKPLIEVVHHACQAGAYDEAYRITYDRVYQGYPARTLVNQLGAWETAYMLMLEFFSGGDATQEPQPKSSNNKRWILNEIGLCLMNLGRLHEAVPFYERGNAMDAKLQDWHNASIGYRNLADIHASLGALEESAKDAREAVTLAQRAAAKWEECKFLAVQAKSGYLQGNLEMAGATFRQAEALVKEIDPELSYLYSDIGIFHADHLRRTDDLNYARRVTEANLQILERFHVAFQISQCHRVLGDLDFDSVNHESASAHYESALKIARSISFRPALIEALLARGRFAAKTSEAPKSGETSEVLQAFSDLNEALNYAVDGGYRIYEADIRVALAWAHLAASTTLSAKAEAERALQMSQEMGYHWGKVDAEEVLKRMKAEG